MKEKDRKTKEKKKGGSSIRSLLLKPFCFEAGWMKASKRAGINTERAQGQRVYTDATREVVKMKKPARKPRGVERRRDPPKATVRKEPRVGEVIRLNEVYREGVCFGYAEGFSAGQAFEMGTASPDQVKTLSRILSELAERK